MKTSFRDPRSIRTLAAIALLLGLVACAAPRPDAAATADLQATRGNTASGTVRFVQNGDTVKVSGEVKGLKPNAEHGFHVHEKGDCSSGDGMSGGHFNPTATAHGQHGQGTHHVGDLPSLKADAQGVAKVDFTTTTGLTLKPGATSIMDKGLIVHRDPDDYKTQPTGNSGARVACGVIRAS